MNRKIPVWDPRGHRRRGAKIYPDAGAPPTAWMSTSIGLMSELAQNSKRLVVDQHGQSQEDRFAVWNIEEFPSRMLRNRL